MQKTALQRNTPVDAIILLILFFKSSELMFGSFHIHDWRQFQNVQIDFHNRLTILTGANGSGKSSILHLLIRHYGWNKHFISTPKKNKMGIMAYFSGLLSKFFNEDSISGQTTIGEISYSDGTSTEIQIPNTVGQQFDTIMPAMKTMRGLHVASHRYVFTAQNISQIETTPPTRDQIFNTYSDQLKSFYISGSSGQSPNFHLKKALVSLVTFGYGNEHVKQNLDAINTFEGFQEILRIVLPPKLGFEKIIVDVPEVLFVTKTGEFPLDGVSGGVGAIVDIAWQIYMYSNSVDRFVVTIDEPENHLHPELQRTLLPNFLAAFPNAQFIVATHNPFIVSSVPDSNVYVLDYNDNNKVESTYLDLVNKAGTSNDILREVLGLPTTMPIWVEQKLNTIVEKYSKMEFHEDTLSALRTEMSELGLEKVIPETISKISQK